jgi:hypothetical protein
LEEEEEARMLEDDSQTGDLRLQLWWDSLAVVVGETAVDVVVVVFVVVEVAQDSS